MRAGAAIGATITAAFLALGGGPCSGSPAGDPDVRASAQVTDVVDGDTIVVALGSGTETVRLLGIDTPEKPGGPRPAECGGTAASERTAELVPPGTVVTLERDQDSRDQYGRVLAYVTRTSDQLFVNEALIAEGHATASFYEPNTTWRTQFRRAELLAQRDNRGFWGACGGPEVLLDPDA